MVTEKGPKSVEILVVNGQMTYHPALIHALREDTITWTCHNGPFAIQFPGMSPLQGADFQSDNPSNPSLEVAVRANAQSATYSYACAVFDNATQKVYMDAACPAIIID